MEKGEYLVMYKTEDDILSGYVYVPAEIYNEGLRTMKAAEFEKDRVSEILRKKRDKNLSDVKAIICNSPKEDIDKIIESLNRNFK